ncbi:Serine/threonine-protein kinase Nek6 [Nosema bombycis CQ1]|uniref:non-specific serine/threonine protein kinase n=1 Tax=Nosema bombycis (strain CQ1 / CVCC 102059) TaxID=578461 RepID=R0MAP6_NOSB1|nr:Serine/threonine-protein kinase Nek6 [Nosema bombycis CQ1]|eukprot:EOB15039.1 Serine/threonine-protein kinase Nek6 [Nosema bombycis CQ1]
MDKYSFVEKLGRGSHGTVYLLETNDSRRVRVVCKSVVEKFIKHAQKEVSILKELNNKRIIKLIEYIQIKGSSFLILEYANHGTLDTVIKFFIQKNRKASQYLLWSVISQVAEALEYLHKRCIIHRDIKPSNILINQIPSKIDDILEFKLCDFSLAMELKQEDDYLESTLVGTPFYMSPEIIQKKKYNNTVDIWSLGVSMYELATLNRPFIGENRAELFNSILTNEINMNIIEDEYLRDLISMCLQKDNRPSSKWLSSQDKIRLHIANLENKFKDSRIAYLENRLKILESHMKWSPSSPRHN